MNAARDWEAHLQRRSRRLRHHRQQQRPQSPQQRHLHELMLVRSQAGQHLFHKLHQPQFTRQRPCQWQQQQEQSPHPCVKP